MEANFGKNVAFENVICSSTEKEKTKLRVNVSYGSPSSLNLLQMEK